MRSFFPEIGGSSASLMGAITANQEQFEFWLRIAGTSVAIIAGTLTIISLLRNWKRKG